MKKLLIILMAVVLAILSVAATGCAKTPDSETDLEITLWDSGNGREFLDNAVSAYRKIHPEINIIVNSSAVINTAEITDGAGYNTVDLYFSCYDADNNKSIMEPLNDVLDAKPDGETGRKLLEKLDPIIVERITNNDGNVYSLPWGSGFGGLVYNKTLFEQKGYSIPKTTTELIRLCETMVIDDGVTPFIHFPAYWNNLLLVWAAQYDGLDNYIDNRSYRYNDGTTIYEHDIRSMISENTGRYQALNALYELISPKGYTYPGTNSLLFTESQTFFLDGVAAMMPNGSWVQNEMRGTPSNIELGMMKTPVFNGMVERLGISEKQLSAAVAMIDGDTLTVAQQQLVEEISEEAMNEIREVRNLGVTNICGLNAFIPAYSVAKTAAKDFLKFFYSDQNMRIYENSTHMKFPADYSDPASVTDMSEWSKFEQDCAVRLGEIDSLDFKLRGDGDKLKNVIGELKLIVYGVDPVLAFCAPSGSPDRKTLSEYWEAEKKYWTDNFDRYLTLANLK